MRNPDLRTVDTEKVLCGAPLFSSQGSAARTVQTIPKRCGESACLLQQLIHTLLHLRIVIAFRDQSFLSLFAVAVVSSDDKLCDLVKGLQGCCGLCGSCRCGRRCRLCRGSLQALPGQPATLLPVPAAALRGLRVSRELPATRALPERPATRALRKMPATRVSRELPERRALPERPAPTLPGSCLASCPASGTAQMLQPCLSLPEPFHSPFQRLSSFLPDSKEQRRTFFPVPY